MTKLDLSSSLELVKKFIEKMKTEILWYYYNNI
jgi:hypothetical protein